jgi:hypothetical protein
LHPFGEECFELGAVVGGEVGVEDPPVWKVRAVHAVEVSVEGSLLPLMVSLNGVRGRTG